MDHLLYWEQQWMPRFHRSKKPSRFGGAFCPKPKTRIQVSRSTMCVHVELAEEWVEPPLLILEVRGSNTAPSESTTSLPRRCSQRSRVHRRISELSEGGGVKQKNYSVCVFNRIRTIPFFTANLNNVLIYS